MTKEIQKKEKTLVFNDLEFNLADSKQITNFQNTYAKGTSTEELASFIGVVKATGLNPFKREVWCIKYGDNPAQIFVGRDGYRKVAKQHKDYIYHRVDVICENDETEVENGKLIKHKYSFKDRGKIIGAYCIVRKKGFDEEIYNFVDFKEYYQGNRVVKNGVITDDVKKGRYGAMKETTWDTKPETMIKKVAEAQTLRMVFDELLEGTYEEAECFVPESIPHQIETGGEEEAEKIKQAREKLKQEKLQSNQEKNA